MIEISLAHGCPSGRGFSCQPFTFRLGEKTAAIKKITDEGSHILVRDGIGQNAYLTSSVVDLDKYIDKKVQVWGKTYSAQKAGWLMDIGRIKLVQ
mgnify:CR=1 FL=1